MADQVGSTGWPGKPADSDLVAHGNRKAIVSLVLGLSALASVAALAVLSSVSTSDFDPIGAEWILLPFIGLVAGSIGSFLGALAWIDVRRGVTRKHLLPAQIGAITGGLAAGLVLLALAALFALFVILVIGFSNGGID